jgi:protoporphyrinogen oxidase
MSKVAIIGAGFTGLSSAAYLSERGNKAVIFEAGERCGGLAEGFNPGNWGWNLESFYHHIFTNDQDIIDLAEKVGWPTQEKEPLTTSFINGQEIQLDSPMSLLKFKEISLWSRIHMGVGLALLKIIPNGLSLEKYKATKTLPRLLGRQGYEAIWEKLLKAKFGPYVDRVNMAWFWARVSKRTKNLGYFEGGFQKLANKIGEFVVKNGGEIRLKTAVKTITTKDRGVLVNGEYFDAVIMTVPAPIAEKLIGRIKMPKIDYLWGQTLVVELNQKLIKGYWMNILEKDYPFLVVVEQTNLIDKKKYGGKEIVYLGNYLADGDKRLSMEKEELLELYLPYLKKINKDFEKKWLKRSFLFRKPFAQPVFPINYSKELPEVKVKSKPIYLANMSMVYPFDRGTNYAVKMGAEVAETVLADIR